MATPDPKCTGVMKFAIFLMQQQIKAMTFHLPSHDKQPEYKRNCKVEEEHLHN
ncbi:hypothetical protein SK128_004844 [Halocaridina rubra]|uniref:Uncharacterized protein n=1 Tax=Halocaridina rubra TaxID=373956 RepID=A0AAN8X9S3_HALRR